MNNFLRYYATFENKDNKKVTKVTAKLKVSDVKVNLRATDFMLQSGILHTGYTINTKEMLNRSNEVVKHYNILVRGQENGIIVNNDGTATSGLDFYLMPEKTTTGPIKIETLNKTKRLEILDNVQANTKLSVDSFNYKVINNNKETNNYKGSFVGLPSIFGSYNIDMSNRDIANFVFTIKEYDKKDRY